MRYRLPAICAAPSFAWSSVGHLSTTDCAGSRKKERMYPVTRVSAAVSPRIPTPSRHHPLCLHREDEVSSYPEHFIVLLQYKSAFIASRSVHAQHTLTALTRTTAHASIDLPFSPKSPVMIFTHHIPSKNVPAALRYMYMPRLQCGGRHTSNKLRGESSKARAPPWQLPRVAEEAPPSCSPRPKYVASGCRRAAITYKASQWEGANPHPTNAIRCHLTL